MTTFSGQSFCEAHFKEMFEKRVRNAVREFSMIKAREHIGVAVSGGKDSMVMLRLLVKLRERLPMKLSAILVDEGIAGYRNKTIPTARRECAKLRVPLHIASFKKEFGKSLDQILDRRNGKRKIENKKVRSFGACTYCGVFRRTLLNRAARRLKVDKLAMGHNLDDAAQTVLMNLMRNEPQRLARFGPKAAGGARGGPAREADGTGPQAPNEKHSGLVPRIQPLIRCPEKEVALYAVLSGIGIHFMSCPNANEAMRQEVRRLLNEMEEKYPGTKTRIFNAFLQMQPALRKGMENEKTPRTSCPTCGDASSNGACAACKLLAQLGLKI